MEILFKIIKTVNLLKKYIVAHLLMSVAILYFLISIFLKLIFSIDVLIPCLWKTIFHFECPGCGLTTAFIDIVIFDFKGAYNSNPLIFIVLPIVIYFVIKDFMKFIQK